MEIVNVLFALRQKRRAVLRKHQQERARERQSRYMQRIDLDVGSVIFLQFDKKRPYFSAY